MYRYISPYFGVKRLSGDGRGLGSKDFSSSACFAAAFYILISHFQSCKASRGQLQSVQRTIVSTSPPRWLHCRLTVSQPSVHRLRCVVFKTETLTCQALQKLSFSLFDPKPT